jgi:tryptophan synthase beta chain
MEGFKLLCHLEGIIPALESAHAVGYVLQLAPQMEKDQIILLNLSGRGDKDLGTVMQTLGNIEKKNEG